MDTVIKDLADLGASTRLLNVIRNMDFSSVEDIKATLRNTERFSGGEAYFLRQPNFGRRCMDELKVLLTKHDDTVPVGWDHIRISQPCSIALDQMLGRIAQEWGVHDPNRIGKFIADARDELGTFMDGFGADKED